MLVPHILSWKRFFAFSTGGCQRFVGVVDLLTAFRLVNLFSSEAGEFSRAGLAKE